MFLFHKKTLLSSGIFEGMTDYHSHILPGVDDGIRSMEDSLAVLEYYETLGITSVWCTPHIMEDIPNTTARLRSVFGELKEAYKGPITLHLASENMLDSLFETRLEQNDFLPLGEFANHLLVETSYFTPPFNMDEMFRRIKSAGYFPVLAHPERYVYMGEKEYRKYHDESIQFQLNVTSLAGSYGYDSRRKAEWLLKKGLYNFYGTDIHSLNSFKHRLKERIKVNIPDENRF